MSRSPSWRRRSQTITTDTIAETVMKNQRCQPPASARKLKAAPVLYTRTRLKKDVTVITSPGVNARVTHALVARSAATIVALSASQRIQEREGSGMAALFSRPFEVGSAAPADGCVPLHRTHVRTVVPAAFALRVRAHADFDVDLIARASRDRRLRRDERESQVVAERLQSREVLRGHRERDLGLERGPERARSAAFLDALHHCAADRAQPRPLGRERRLVRLGRQDVVPGVEEDAVAGRGALERPGLLRRE